MKTQILLLVWFSIQVILSDRDLLQQPDITPNITSSPYYDTWSPARILSDIGQVADLCNCCAAIFTPGYIDIDLMHPYSVYQIVILGRIDNGVHFQNISLSTSNGHIIPVANKTNTYISTIINPRQFIQMIRISSHQSGGVMTICNVKVYGREYLTGIPSQSSVYSTCIAERALNGNEDYGTDDTQLCKACSVTNTENSWWYLDFGGEHLIRRIQVIGRDNVLQSCGLRVSIANALVGTDVVTQGNISVLGLDQHINPPRLASSINITSISGAQNMVLCAVRISETDCPIGTYGDKCAERCGHCRGGIKQCDYVNGNCKMGCETGYVGLPCAQSCNSSYYGENCAQRCGNCLDGMRCDLKNGNCPGKCSPGYLGLYCNQSCNSSYYGEHCAHRCGNCLDAMRCDLQTGSCPVGCSAGYSGLYCNQTCTDYSYGENCSSRCGHCHNKGVCEKESGNCPAGGCDRGYTGVRCKTTCNDGFYGNGCSFKCGQCRDAGVCHKVLGNCPAGRCERGYEGVKCTSICRDKTFGYNCEELCHCHNTSEQCNITNGGCRSDCAIGWGGSNCSEDKNIIQTGTTNVKALIPNYYQTCDASRSIDGNILRVATTNDTVLCQLCSVAIGPGQPLLQLDLNEVTAVAYIRVYGRDIGVGVGQSSNLNVYAKNTSITEANNWETWTHLGDIMKSDNVNGVVLDLYSQRIFRYLAFTTKNGTTLMTICEVKLYGKDCPLGHFGDECLNQCHCKDGQWCSDVTGECSTLGCFAGWKGVSCNISCEHGEYGENCQNNCHCYKDQECATDTGFCSNELCAPGWQTRSCNIECDHGCHGQNCSSKCYCYNDDDCNPVNGTCNNKRCSPGWQGDTCSSECGTRKFGQDCSYTCNCVNGTSCDPINGLCSIPDCEEGWQGKNCSNGCDKQTFGYNCKHVCHCYECDDKDGSCGIYSCNRDWEGESCSKRIQTNEIQAESTKTGEGNSAFAVVLTLLVVSVIGHVVVVAIYCRRKARKSHAKGKKRDQNYYTVPAPSMSSDYATLDVTEMSNIPNERRYINVTDDL